MAADAMDAMDVDAPGPGDEQPGAQAGVAVEEGELLDDEGGGGPPGVPWGPSRRPVGVGRATSTCVDECAIGPPTDPYGTPMPPYGIRPRGGPCLDPL